MEELNIPIEEDSFPKENYLKLDYQIIVEALFALNCTNWITIRGDSYDDIEWEGEPSVTKEQVESKIEELIQNKPMNVLRERRNRMIAETDWWVLADRTPTPEQLAYRQALRDITDNVTPVFTEDKTDITGFDWPEKP